MQLCEYDDTDFQECEEELAGAGDAAYDIDMITELND
jgi:hypothetical protein